jgi:hypothetical protein
MKVLNYEDKIRALKQHKHLLSDFPKYINSKRALVKSQSFVTVSCCTVSKYLFLLHLLFCRYKNVRYSVMWGKLGGLYGWSKYFPIFVNTCQYLSILVNICQYLIPLSSVPCIYQDWNLSFYCLLGYVIMDIVISQIIQSFKTVLAIPIS